MNLTDFDANLYRLYAVGLLGYEEALSQAQSLVRLRRAMLAFDQNARVRESVPAEEVSGQPPATPRSPSSGSRPGLIPR
jgi:Tfp pilus assembly ATPase PilU